MTAIKICCISTAEEALLAMEAGADVLGLVSEMPSGPGVIEWAQIQAILATTEGQAVDTFVLTSQRDPHRLARQYQCCPSTALQLVCAHPPSTYDVLRRACPGVAIVQVIHVQDDSAIDQALAVDTHVDALLLDSGKPDLSVPELGGTGRVHDWRISRAIVEACDSPVWLAGGLNEYNVLEAVESVRPHGVDLCSSVRSNDRLDPVKLKRFVAVLRSSG